MSIQQAADIERLKEMVLALQKSLKAQAEAIEALKAQKQQHPDRQTMTLKK